MSYDEEQAKGADEFVAREPQQQSRSIRRSRATRYFILFDLLLIFLLTWTLKPLIVLLVKNEQLFGHHTALSGETPLKGSNRLGRHSIPRILHQTSPSDLIPEKWIESQKSCKAAYPEFEYKLWTDATARDFLESEYPWFLNTWDNYAFPIQRADSIRYFVLYHYGGLYLDMDMFCNKSFPLQEFESDTHSAVVIATNPTGVTNDWMISTARHPAFGRAVSNLPVFHRITRLWARFLPYCNIMMSTGPLFLSLAFTDYLLQEPSLPSSKISVVDPSVVAPYVTDFQTCTWHRADARILVWMGRQPWTWFLLGGVGVGIGLIIINHTLIMIYKAFKGIRRRVAVDFSDFKQTKLM